MPEYIEVWTQVTKLIHALSSDTEWGNTVTMCGRKLVRRSLPDGGLRTVQMGDDFRPESPIACSSCVKIVRKNG